MPPHLAARFTMEESAVLAVIAVEVAKRGRCTLTIGHIAALAGVGKTTVRTAVQQAVGLGCSSLTSGACRPSGRRRTQSRSCRPSGWPGFDWGNGR